LLRGDGQGGFQAVSALESGLRIFGEQRGAAVADYDRDGRLDLAVTQNGAATRLFHNQTARPGFLIHLRGPPGNPTAVGAQLHWIQDNEKGPIREIQAGSGYWSQMSACPVLAVPNPERPARIFVRWADRKTGTYPVPSGAQRISISQSGIQ
jgi:hypothetical protein